MSFRAYPEYKPSGFDWLPEVPAHWVDRKIARDIPFVVGWTPPSGKDEYYDGDLPWVTIADMTQMSVEDTKSKISHLAVQDKGAKVVPAGSMLFSFKLSVGKIAFLTIDSYTNEAIAGFLPCGPLDLEYWKYAAPEFIPRYGRENIYGATLLNQELISSVRFSAPARAEQTQIARFLDHETARIDALIEEQQRLIELLKEKRQAVIFQAVTKGLDPAVSMKDSGVEWLGEMPAHWVVSRAKLVSDIFVPQRNKPELNDSDGIAWVTMEDMNGGYISATNLKVTELAADEAGSKVLKKGAVIASCVGRFGIVAINAVDVVINQQLQAFEPRKIKAEYLKNIVSLSKQYFELIGTAATLVYVNQQGFENLPVLIPFGSEQESICLYVDEASARFDALLSQSFESIQLLQERRSALISAAVTGKIDVRGWQPPASAPTPELTQEAV
ncbi:restriction endonuclease subunit S [Stenotrophomonas sp.]|uniref:restriction endonuclease subunit S n=1 Tax=Stenotrophomonas sp. TaxID=69392 RepID=UPI0029BBD2EC|nr:restriction endonuclease subunit S [Stenotrophomonas sp.]MDX3934759.1 restriction endonuclease subunit S [Stenotrophomonas sp.]